MEETETTQQEAVASKRHKGRHGLGYVYQHRANWWLDVRVNGARHRLKIAPVKLFEKREARHLADAKIKDLLTPKPPEPPPEKGTMPLSAFAEKFLARAIKTKRSWEQYSGKPLKQTPLKHAVRHFLDTPLKDITADKVEDFRGYLLNQRVGQRRLKSASANRYVSVLRHVFNCAVLWKDAEQNPVAKLKPLYEPPMPERVLQEGTEQAAMLGALPTWLRLMSIVKLQTALRRGDLLGLTWESVKDDWLDLCETKEGKRRRIPTNATVKFILDSLRPKDTKPQDYVFEPKVARKTLISRIRREWNRAWKTAGIEKIRFHELRHTALTRLDQRGVDAATIKDIAGHSSLRTTQRYLHSGDRQKRQAVEALDNGEFGRHLPTTAEPDVVKLPVSGRIQ